MSVVHNNDEEKARYKALKLKNIRDYHNELINVLGIEVADFQMKTPFRDQQGNLVVGIFPSEFRKPKGLFFEIVDYDWNPSDPQRKVYRIAPSSSYEDEYELTVRGSYLVPIEELRSVNLESYNISKSGAFTSSDELFPKSKKSQDELVIQRAPAIMEDAPFSEMTIRDYFAIKNNKPVSSRPWLNELIKNKQ